MITFGLTGGIATGKSNITKTFRQYDIPIVDADIVARQVVEPGTDGLDRVISAFGKEYLENGSLNRIKLGALVFSDKVAMIKLSAIMSPLIQKESDRQIERLHKEYEIVGYDAALIIEMGNAKKYQPLIVVSCPQEIQIDRLMKRNGLTHQQALSRINAQLPLEAKIKFADFIINTAGSLDDTVTQTFSILQELKEINRKSI